MAYVLGIDIGTSSSKAVAVDEDGEIRATEQVAHEISRPRPGWAEQDASIWWSRGSGPQPQGGPPARCPPAAVCVSGMGPLPSTDHRGRGSLRAAILYGIDTRAEQIQVLSEEIGDDELLRRGGSLLSSQAVGPKMLWLRNHEPEVWSRTRRFFMPSSFAVWKLTGDYILDHHSASQCNPLYDLTSNRWNEEMVDRFAPGLEFPRLLWPAEVVAGVTAGAADATGWRSAPVSGHDRCLGRISKCRRDRNGRCHAHVRIDHVPDESGPPRDPIESAVGDGRRPQRHRDVGRRNGHRRDRRLVAGELVAQPVETLMASAADVPPGAEGLLLLPYFAGERTPIFDPRARGTLLGLTLSHGRPQIMRAILEGVALGVRHNLEAFDEVSPPARRYVAVGGGARTPTWPQIVSDVSGITQMLPRHTVGARWATPCFAAEAAGMAGSQAWNAIEHTIEPNPEHASFYGELFDEYRRAYLDTRAVTHNLVDLNQPRNIKPMPAQASPTDR